MNKPISASELNDSINLPATAPTNAGRKRLRKTLLLALAGKVLLLGLSYYGYEKFFASRYVTTDNAYVSAETAQVTPLVGGPVKGVYVSDTDVVGAGQILVVLDNTDARI